MQSRQPSAGGGSVPGPGHTAVVTGAAGGLGAEIARALHRSGFRVVLTDRDGASSERLAQELDGSGQTALGLQLDVAAPGAFDALLHELVGRFGHCEVLVNCAAITEAKPVFDISDAEFNAVMAVNAGGTFAGSRVFGAHFRDRGYGRIINVASLAGQNGGTATGAHYAASKGAILTLTKAFARELAQHGVTVNAVAPGPLDLPSVHAIVGRDRLEGFAANIPVGHLGEARFIAEIVARLAAPDAGFVTGACWDANGGLFMR